jgi:hypothetical protein
VARAMGLNSSDDWEKIVSRGDCPVDIPQVSACPSSPSTERACVCLELPLSGCRHKKHGTPSSCCPLTRAQGSRVRSHWVCGS